MSSLYQQSSQSFIASAGNLCGDSLAATARMHWYQAKISCKLPARRKLRWISKEHTHICHDCVANARNCQKVLCVFGLTGQPADFALKRLNPVLVIPNALDHIAQRVDHQLHGVTFKAVDAFINLFIELINALWHNMSVFGK